MPEAASDIFRILWDTAGFDMIYASTLHNGEIGKARQSIAKIAEGSARS